MTVIIVIAADDDDDGRDDADQDHLACGPVSPMPRHEP